MSALTIATLFHTLIGIFLVGLILIQSQETGLSSSFSNFSGSFYRSKRGLEKAVFITTIVLGALFTISSFLQVFLRK